jgi:phage FluMu gp28-like protein
MDTVTNIRPAHVPAKFAGRCKVYPTRDALLLPYQERWVLDDSRLKLMEKARQIGISWATAYALVRRKARKGAVLDAWVSSRDETQARLFLEDSKAFAAILHAGGKDLGERVVDDQGNSAFILALANGLRIHSMSSNADAQAGKRGDRVLDEFALHPDPRKLYTIAYPGITWGGQLEIVSTHRGSANYFNELVREIRERGNKKAFSLHRVTLQDALDQGFLFKLQAKLPPDDPRQEMDEAAYFDFIRSGCADEESFLQEYMCAPADDAGAFLSYDQIAACEYGTGFSWEATLAELAACANPLHVGVDIGRTHDLTVIWVIEKAAGRGLTRKVVTMKNETFDAQEAELYPILALPKVRRCCIDNTGIGRQLAERAQQKFGTYKVEAVTFTGPVKEELAYPLKAAFEDLNLRIPCSPEIRADLRAIRKETTAAGNIRITADRGKGGHSDRFWALALAWHAGATGDLGPCRAEPANAANETRADGGPDNSAADDPDRQPAWSY